MSTAITSRDPGYPTDRENYLTNSSGILSWIFTLDHKRIGLMYLVGVMTAFAVGGLLALAIRLHLLDPEGWMFTGAEANNIYNQVFTLHGAIMVFLFIIPSIPAALGNFLVPVMLGAKDVAFPRLNLSSFYLWCFGAIFFVSALFSSGLDTGWTFYTPYSTTTDTSVILATLGAFILGFSSIFTGLNFIVTINTMRPPGMTWFKMPLFLWATYATSIIQVLATPVLGITLLLLIAERTMHVGIFDPEFNGDPVTYQHFFWFYSHPAVYIMILPAFGIISELISVHSHKHIFGYRFIAYSSIAIALLGFLVWGHHMFTSGMSSLTTIIFSALTFTVSVPSAIKVFNWLATMYKGSISLTTPMCYAISFIFLFTIGGLTGLFLGTLATDLHLHDTYFVVAHFHYVMVGGTLIAFLGGVFHWWPKMVGKLYNEFHGRIASLLVFLGFNGTFLPQFVLGSRGMPRRYATYDPEFAFLHQMSTYGALLLGCGLLYAFIVLMASLAKGRRAPANPWGGATLEWACTSPPPYYNFERPPVVGDPYDFHNIEWDSQEEKYISTEPQRKLVPEEQPAEVPAHH
ncbi:cbb3-type cytochrome c oxidase subunit I [Rhodopirellula sp. SWK7]|uniref:cytochrome c oxidase subunit I n=1 Tax=Rhodopirellula sp. SWK7 TaxID=595460 RepID=UPI0002BE4A67|nr:cbb3-type cytochrome c oxidase subunit I [Rhodopirellula sp. SWK7]EMI44131.1 cytochrome c oxidase, subunit I [Rhodopirellula sp. SWK7]